MTRMRTAQEALQEREERFRLMVENMPVLIHAHDEQGRYVFWNRECEKVSGYSAEEILGNPRAVELLYPDPKYRANVLAPAHELDQPFENRTLTMTSRSGEKRIVSWSNLSPVCPVPGWPYWEVGVEVTRQRQAEKELESSIELFAKAFGSAQVAVAVSRTSDGAYLDANPGFLRLTGYGREELLGSTSRELGFFTESQRRQLTRDIREHGGLKDQEMVFRTKNGELRTILFSINPVTVRGEACYVATMVDITGRKLAEEALRHSEAYLRAVFESSRDMICTRDAAGRLARCNQAYADFVSFSYGVEAGPGLRPADYMPPERAERWESLLRHVLSGASLRETFCVAREGVTRWYDVSLTPIMHEGKALGTAEYTRDVTRTKRVEEDLARKAKLLEQAELLAGFGVWEGDLRREVWTVSENWRRIHGVEQTELASEELWPLAHPDDVPAIASAFARCRELGEPYSIRHRIRRPKTGEIRHLQAYGKIEYDPETGEPQRMIGAAQDITDRIMEERRLLVARYALDSSIGAVLLANLEGRVEYVNDAFRKLFGYSDADPLLGARPADFLADPEEEQWLLQTLGRQGQFVGELRVRRKNGERFLIRISAHLVSSPEGEPLCHMATIMDVTSQRETMDRLLQSEERFESLAENINGILFRGSMNFAPHFMRGAVHSLTGYNEEEFLSGEVSWDMLIHPEDLARLMDAPGTRKLLTHPGHSLNREYRILRKDGQVRWVHENIHNVPDGSGTPQFVEGVVLDVTERRRTEAALLASYERFRKVVDMLPQLVSYVDKDLVYRFVNRQYEEFFGLKAAHIQGRRVREVIGEKAYATALKDIQRALAGETVHYEFELDYPGERRRIMDGWLLPDQDESGAVLGYYAVLHDVTHLREAQAALRRSEARYRTLFEHTSEAVLLNDAQGAILEANQAALDMLGYSAGELGQLHLHELAPPEDADAVRSAFQGLTPEGAIAQELRLLRKDGAAIHVQGRGRGVAESLLLVFLLPG